MSFITDLHTDLQTCRDGRRCMFAVPSPAARELHSHSAAELALVPVLGTTQTAAQSFCHHCPATEQ